MVDNGIFFIDIPGAEIWKDFMLNSPIPEYNKLGETTFIPKNWDEYYATIVQKGKPHNLNSNLW